MSLDDSAVLLPGTGHFLIGNVAAAQPVLADLTAFAADTSDLPTGFTDLGHTDLDQILTFGQDGGDTTVKGSWQNKSLREIVTTETVDFISAKSLQLDNTVLSLYYGGGDATGTNTFEVPDSGTPTEKALCLIMLDGTTPVAIYASKVSIRRESEIEVASDDFTKFPLRFTFLKNASDPKLVWIGADLGV